MKNLLYLIGFTLILIGCGSDSNPLDVPSDVTNVQGEPRVGGVQLSWDLPPDSSFLYLDISFNKYPDDPDRSEIIRRKASRYTDTLLVDGLLNRYQYTFTVQPYNADPDNAVSGTEIQTEPVRPIRRPVDVVYFPDELTQIEDITPDMIDTFTQEQSEGPRDNLLDGNINTFWHSAWSANVAPLPHWIEVNFDESTKMGAFSYTLRQGANAAHHPNRFALEVSEDGEEWEEVWRSSTDLPTSPATQEFTLDFGKNYEYSNYRVLIVETPAMGTFTYLSTISFFEMKEELTDLEELAEENY